MGDGRGSSYRVGLGQVRSRTQRGSAALAEVAARVQPQGFLAGFPEKLQKEFSGEGAAFWRCLWLPCGRQAVGARMGWRRLLPSGGKGRWQPQWASGRKVDLRDLGGRVWPDRGRGESRRPPRKMSVVPLSLRQGDRAGEGTSIQSGTC